MMTTTATPCTTSQGPQRKLHPSATTVIETGDAVASTPNPHDQSFAPAHPLRSVEDLLAAKGTEPIRSLDDLAADTFESDQELDEFLAFNHAERHREAG